MASTAGFCPRVARYALRYMRSQEGFQSTRPCQTYCNKSQYEPPDIRKLAELAQLHVTDEEVRPGYHGHLCRCKHACLWSLLIRKVRTVRYFWFQVEAWTPQLNKVTEFFAQLQAIDLTDVPPTLRVTGEDADMLPRVDSVETHPMSAEFLDSVPARDGDFIKVPPIQGEQ